MQLRRIMLRYAREQRHPALFAEMRLGKTLVAIRRCKLIRPHDDRLRVLVVAPNSALGSWERELHLEGEEGVAWLEGTREERLTTLRDVSASWYLINKEGHLVIPEIGGQRPCEACRGRGWTRADDGDKIACGRCGRRGYVRGEPCPWDAIILDESPFIKNVRARVTQFFLRNFKNVPHRFALTGMPCPEGPLDLWAQLAWLDGGAAFGFKSFWGFRSGMFAPAFGWDWQPKAGNLARIERDLGRRAFVLSRREAGLSVPKVHETRRVQMPKALRSKYRTAEREFVLQDLQGKEIKRTIYATTRWHWLRQMCGGHVDERLVWPGKINELVSLLKTELAGEQVVVWFAYNEELRASARAIKRAKVSHAQMYGKTPAAARREMEGMFRDGKIRVLLVQQKIAEFGMDLGAADTAVFFSRHAALQTNAQSTDRIVRVGKKGVLLIDIVVEDSVDEDVAELVATKAWKTQGLLDAAIAERVKGRASR